MLIILNIFFGQSVLRVLLFSDGQGDEASEMTLSDKEQKRIRGEVWPGQRGHSAKNWEARICSVV